MSGFTAGQFVNFSWWAEDSAADIAEGITALIDFGDGTSDSVICNANGIGTTRHKYSEAGYYFLMLTLVDKGGYRSSLLGQVTVEQAANTIAGQEGGGDPSSVYVQDSFMLSVTNIVLHYVTQSIPSNAVIPPFETGIVNVLTEVNVNSAIAIPSAWATQYPSFTDKFGDDLGAAITKPSGKRDGAGNQMFVWQDFVAGTDPTNPDDVLLASITYDAQRNEPIISWSPELSAEEAAKRSYKIYGKVHLNDDKWTLINGNAAEYNFFKVSVEMK